MNKKRYLIVIGIILLGVIGYGSFVKTVFSKKIKIDRPNTYVASQISQIENLVRWVAPFSKTDSSNIKYGGKLKAISDNSSLEIVQANALSVLLKLTADSKTEQVVLKILPDTANVSHLELSYECTWLQKMLGTNELINNALSSTQSFNEYLNDTQKVYDYQIEVVPVTDTTFLFSQAHTKKIDSKQTIHNLFTSLIDHAKETNAGYNGTRIIHILTFGIDSISINTAIAVTNSQIEQQHMTGNFIFKRMPYQKNLLAAYYQGRFDGIPKVYRALEKFKADYHFSSMAIPFAKLMTTGVDFSDDQVIQAIVYYPVY